VEKGFEDEEDDEDEKISRSSVPFVFAEVVRACRRGI